MSCVLHDIPLRINISVDAILINFHLLFPLVVESAYHLLTRPQTHSTAQFTPPPPNLRSASARTHQPTIVHITSCTQNYIGSGDSSILALKQTTDKILCVRMSAARGIIVGITTTAMTAFIHLACRVTRFTLEIKYLAIAIICLSVRVHLPTEKSDGLNTIALLVAVNDQPVLFYVVSGWGDIANVPVAVRSMCIVRDVHFYNVIISPCFPAG